MGAHCGFNLRKLHEFAKQFRFGQAHPALAACFKQWGVRYLAATKKQFVKNSRGGGDWPPLSPATIRSRVRKAVNLKMAKRGRKKKV